MLQVFKQIIMRIIKITHNNLSLCILYSVMNKRCNMKGSILPKRMLLLLVLLRFLRVLTRGQILMFLVLITIFLKEFTQIL